MNGLASPSSDALRSLSVVSELQFLWRCFASATVPSEKRRYLVQFLNQFVSEFADTESDLVELRFGGTRLVARDLVWHFISHISELCQAGGEASTPLGEASKARPSPMPAHSLSPIALCRSTYLWWVHAPAALIFEYLSGLSQEGEGFYLLWTLEILAKNVSNARIANGLATTLVAILVRLLELPADFLLRREARAHYPHVPAFYAFHFPLVSQLFAVDDIPTCLAFLDTMASPSSSSSPSSPPSSSSSLSSASSVGGVGGAYGLGGMPDIPANAMLASLCYHMLSVLSHLFKYPGTLKELVQYKKLSAFVGLFKPLSAGTERRKSNKQKATADLYGSGRSGALKTANSKTESVGYALDAFGIFAVQRQLIRTMASLFITSSRKKKSIELIHQQRVLQQLLSNLYKYGDRLSTTTCLELCQLIVFALRSSFALSSSLLDDFIGDGGYQILTHNLIVTSKKGSREEIAKFIGLVTHLLFIGDRNVLFSPPAASASSSSSSADYAQPTRGHGKQHSTRSDPDEENKRLLAQKVIGDEASGNWRNLDSCKILFNALVSCGSTEVKTDLLRTLQVILSLRVTLPIGQSAMAQMLASSSPSATSSASTTTAADQPSAPGASRPPLSSQGSGGYGQALLGGASAGAGRSASGVAQQFVTVTGYQLLQKRFEPFRTLFLQYDTLTLHNQRMVLGMMDDVLRGSDLLTSELKSYCGLLQGKRPSTILLVANHLISLIQRGKIRRTVLKSVGIVPILLEYLANPLHLYCASALIGNDERQLCLELLQPPAAGTNTHASSSRSGHTAKKPSMSSKGGERESESESEEDEEDEELQETCSSEGEAESDETIRAKSEAAPAAELNAHTSKDDEVRRILYALSRRMLKLTFHFLVGNAGNQDAFRRDNGLRRLYAMLNDVALRGPILRVVAIIAIGSSSTPSAGATIKSETGGGTGSEDVGGAIIRDIISVLQSSGGTSALSKEILSMRRDILVALCYMFRHNAKLKDAFRTNGGFIWAISVMNGIGKSIDTEAEEAKEKDAKQAHQAAADSTQPSEGVDDGAVDPESNGDAATAPRSPAPAPSSGSGPEASQEAFTFIKMLLNTLSIALTANVDNRRYFRSEIRFAALAEALQACHFVIHVGQRAIEICDALIDVAVRHSWPPSCPTHYKKYVTIYNKEREKEEKRKRDDEARERRRRQHHAQDHASDFHHYDGNDDHDGEADTFMSARRRSRSFSAISSSSSFSAWASSTRDKIIEETVKSCGVCRGQLEMENPEIFKIIIQLLASAQGRTDDRDICYILNKLTFLATLSPSNQHQIAGVEVVCDLLDHFRGILTAGDLSTLTSTADAAARAAHMAGGGTTTSAAASISSSNTRAFLHSTVLRFVSKIASHSISLQALRKYLKLMKDPADFPVSLLSTLVAIAKRDGHVVPSYFLDFSNSKAGVALPSTEAKVIWPPPEGYTIAFWLNLTSDGSGAHPTSHGSGKRLRIVPGKAVSESHVTNIDLREHKSDEAATHIFTLNSANKQCQTEVLIRAGALTLRLGNKLNATFDDFKFREKRWYHVAITHSPVRAFKQKVASVVKLSVDGLLRGSVPFTYPRPTSAHLFAFLGAPPLSYSLATGAAGASASAAPASVPHRTESASQATLAASLAHDEEAKREASFQLGNLYLFEEAAEEPDVLFLYMLGPNYCGNLDVDLGMFQTYDIINADSVKLLAKGNPISPVNNPYMAGRLAAQRKGAPLSMGLEVSFSGEVPTRSAAAAADESSQWSAGRDYDDGSSDDVSTGGGDQQWADGRAAADSHALLLLDPSLYNDQMSHLDDTIVFLFSARNMVMAQAFRIDSFGTSRAPHQHHLNTSSLLDKEGAAQSTVAPTLQSPGGLGSATVAASPQPPSPSAAGAGAASSASSASTAGAGAGVGASPQKRSGKKTKNHILLANIAHHHDGVALRKRLSIQEMIFNIGGVTNLLWFLSTLPSRHDVLARFVAAAKKRESAADTSASSAASSSESEGEAAAAAQPAAGRSRVNREELPNEEELLSALPEAERLAYKIQIKECVERQRQAIRLLHSLLLNNARNVKELLDVSGYQLLARIIRKHRWTLDETLLSLMFNFVGLRKSRPQSLPYSSASAQAHSSSRMRAPLSSRSVPQFDDDSKKQAPTFIAKVKDLMRNESSTSRKGSLPTPDHLASFAAGGQQPTFAFTSPSGSGSAPATPQREHAFASAAFGPSIVFSDGVVANLPAFVHLILNRKLWGSASVSVQEIVFESLARLVANHEQASFNIMRFREAGLIDIFMRMFKEEADTLCIGFAPTLMVILRSIMTDPPYLTDLQKVVSYLIASHHKFGMARNLSSASPEGVRSISAEGLAKYQTTPARWRNLPSAKGLTLPGLSTASSLMSTNTSTGMVGPGDEALRSIRVHVLQMLLDIVTSGGQQSIRVVESAMSLELLLEFIQHEDEETRIIILKLLDVFLRNSTNRTQFFQMKGWHLLGDILKPFKVGEELLAVLFAMLLGKPTHSYNAPNIGAGATSVTLNFLGKLSDEDIVLQHPGAMTTILVLVGSHFIMPNTRHAAIKTLHDIFLQNDPVKDQFISNHLIELLCDLFVVGYQEKFPATPDNRAAQSQPSPGVSPYSSQQASSDLTPDEQQQTSAAAAAAAAAEQSCESCPPQPDGAQQAETAGAEQQDLSGEPAAAAEEEEGEVEEDEDKEWELEEDVLRFLKTVALHRCVTGTPSTMPPKLLDDIFLTMEVLEGLPREYVVRLRERVLVDVFWFFRDNNIANSSTLLNALQKLCVLALHAWLWRDSIVLLECRKVPASSKPWAYKARDMFKDNVLCMIFALFNILREKIDLTSTQAGLLLAPISLPQMQYRRALLRLLQSNVEPWILSALSKLLPAPTLSPGSSSSYLRSPLSSSLSELRSTNSMLLANIGDKEFVVSFLYHSWPLLAHPNPAISMQTQECWRIVIHSTLDYLSLATLEDLLLQAERHVREANHRKRDREQQRGDGDDGDDKKKKMEEEEKKKKKKRKSGEGGKEEEEEEEAWTRKVKAEQVEEILLEEHISHFVRRTEDTEANAKDKWQKERQKARKKKAIKIFRHKSKVKANGKSVKNHYFALQHEQEKANIQYLSDKEHEEQLLLHQWKDLVKKVTHQEAVWPLPNVIARPLLDATEGTTRMRIRLKPTLTRPLDKLFKEDGEPLEWLSPKMILRLQKLKKIRIGGLYKEQMQKNENHVALKPGEKVLLASKCQCITPFSTREGEMVVGAKYTYFFDMSEPYSSLVSTKAPVSSLEATAAIAEGEDPTWAADKRPRKRGQWVGDKSITLQYEDIKEIHKRRYLLKNTAMEIFLTTGRTYLLAFPTKQDRNAIYEKLLSLNLPNRVDYETEVGGNILKRSITEKWRRGEISNFEYLMHLNTLAGRSFNDLTQYPIFPFLLRDYTSEELDLTNPNTFRDLSKPMGAQDPTRLKKFIDKYEMLLEMNDVPYYYGSHYSNIGSVLHFLVRVQPFTRGFIEFQGGRFDVPDRVFHALDTTWSLSSSMSNSDVKELIPEFFYFPEFLENQNHFDLGIRHDSVRVDNVLLPPWAKGDPRIFIRKHREALECRYVSERLHQWIDLMYGALQRGDAARKAYNVFHPLTYEGAVEVDSIQDEVMRKATIAQISSYGQTPRLLFRRAHPEKVWREPEPTVYSHPHQLWSYPLLVCTFEIHRIDLVDGQPIPQRAKRVLLHPEGTAMVSWGYWDQNIRLCSVETGKVLLVIKTSHDDEILCADITQDGQYLATGGTSSLLKVWKLKRVKQASSRGRMRIRLQAILSGHAHDVLSVVISKEWSLIISGGREGKVILWDLNRLCYIRTLKHHRGPVTSLAISPTTGDIVTVDNGSEFIPVGEKRSPRNVSTICLWTINGRLVASTTCQERINCVALTHGTEGLSRNVVICGLDSGTIKIWDAFDLSFLSEMKNEKETSPITALCLNADFSQLFVGHANGALVSWSPRRMSNPAQLIKNLTLGRRKVTPLSSTSSTSVAIRKASRDLFEREAAAELARLNNAAEGGSSGDEAEQQQQHQHRQRSNSNNSMASSDSEGDSGAEIEERS